MDTDRHPEQPAVDHAQIGANTDDFDVDRCVGHPRSVG